MYIYTYIHRLFPVLRETSLVSLSGCKSSYIQLPHSKFGEASAWSFAARVLSGCAWMDKALWIDRTCVDRVLHSNIIFGQKNSFHYWTWWLMRTTVPSKYQWITYTATTSAKNVKDAGLKNRFNFQQSNSNFTTSSSVPPQRLAFNKNGSCFVSDSWPSMEGDRCMTSCNEELLGILS